MSSSATTSTRRSPATSSTSTVRDAERCDVGRQLRRLDDHRGLCCRLRDAGARRHRGAQVPGDSRRGPGGRHDCDEHGRRRLERPGADGERQRLVVVGGIPGVSVLNRPAWHDANFDDVQDAAERALAGWSVDLYRDGNLQHSALTDANGAWRIIGVAANDTSTTSTSCVSARRARARTPRRSAPPRRRSRMRCSASRTSWCRPTRPWRI